MNEAREPRLTRAILHAVIRGDEREYILGDLAEDFRSIADTAGSEAARTWYRRQAAATLAHWIFRRHRAPLETWVREARVALRGLLRAPTYTATTIATLSLGVGGAVAVAALTRSVLQPLPFPEAGQLYAVWETHHEEQRWVAPANYLDWRKSSDTFSGLAAHDTRSASITLEGRATRESVAVVSGNFFAVLGLSPVIGRTFDPRLEPAFPGRVAIVSHETWVEEFGGDGDIIGRTFMVDDLTYDVVGVMKPGLDFPGAGLFAWLRSPTEAPGIRAFPDDLTQLRDAWYFQVVGRLADGHDRSAAEAEMDAIAAGLTDSYPDTNADSGIRLVPLLDQTISGFGSTLALLSIAITLVLLAAGSNVLHLTLARSAARRHDVAIKISMGASANDIRRSMLVEGWLVGVAGACLGLGLARLLIATAGVRLGAFAPRSSEIAMSPSVAVLGLVLGLGLGSVIATAAYARIGVNPRRRSLRHATASGRPEGRAMIAIQVAVIIALLTGTTLLTRSVNELTRVDLGFSDGNLTTLRVALPDAHNRAYPDRLATYREVADAVRRLADIETVSIGSVAPIRMGTRAGVVIVGDSPTRNPPDAGWQPIDVGYFAALGMTMLRGRDFTDADGPSDRDVAVVNETFARTVLGDRDALGAQVTMGLDGHERPLTIVGVVRDTHTRGPAAKPGPVLYRPLTQSTRFGAESIFLAARSVPGATSSMVKVQRAIREAYPELPVYGEARGEDLARPFRASQTTLLAIMAIFTTIALSLGLVGVFGISAHTVRRRRRDIGVRLALGATGGRVTAEVVAEGMRTALLGVPPGMALAVILGKTIEGLLFGVGPSNVWVLLAVPAVVLTMTATALLASARMAAAIDPAQATREE